MNLACSASASKSAAAAVLPRTATIGRAISRRFTFYPPLQSIVALPPDPGRAPGRRPAATRRPAQDAATARRQHLPFGGQHHAPVTIARHGHRGVVRPLADPKRQAAAGPPARGGSAMHHASTQNSDIPFTAL